MFLCGLVDGGPTRSTPTVRRLTIRLVSHSCSDGTHDPGLRYSRLAGSLRARFIARMTWWPQVLRLISTARGVVDGLLRRGSDLDDEPLGRERIHRHRPAAGRIPGPDRFEQPSLREPGEVVMGVLE